MNTDPTQPSPLSLGPPRRILRPVPPFPPDQTMNPPGLALPNPRSPVSLRARYGFSPTATPSVAYNLNVLSEFLKNRPAQHSVQNRVIAIDGVDRNAVQLVISELHSRICKDLRCTVRVLGGDFPQRPINETSELAYYIGQIHNWAAMWSVVFEASPPIPQSKEPTPSDRLCIWIMPLSPFMATYRAAIRISMTGSYVPSDLWRWLAGHWDGYLKPDITVNIQEIADTATKGEVLRFEGNKMNTLLVTQLRAGHSQLSARQLRRVIFEVEDWIQGEDGFGDHAFP